MKLHIIIIAVTVCIFWVSICFFMISSMAGDLEERHPSFIDKRWKRVLWLLSSIFFIPILALIPYFAIQAIKEFISGDEGKEKRSKDEGKH